MNKATGPHRPALLRRIAKPVKSGLRKFGCAMTERWIAAGGSYDILVLFGMRRSGNHLAINWILGQVPGAVVFYNNIRQHGHPFDVGMREYRLRWPNKRPKIVLSYEDLSPQDIMNGPLPDFLSDRVRRHAANVQCGVILRDPYNLFASRLKKWPERFETEDAICAQQNLYETHADLALNPRPVLGDAPLVPILFNSLVVDADYRDALAQKLNINTGTTGLDQVPVYGHGSSFDGYNAESTSVRAAVFDRWKNSMDNPVFRQIVADELIRKLAKDIFDMGSPA